VTGPGLQGIYGTFSGVFSGSGPLSLEGNGINTADLSLTGNNSGFGGTMSVLDSGLDGGVVFGAQANVPGGAAAVIAIATNGRVRFGGATFANDVLPGGNAAFTVAANQVATLTGSLTGGANNLTVSGSGVLALQPGVGKSVAGTGSTIVSGGGLHVASTNALFSGNLNLNGGVLILDGRGAGGGGEAPSFEELTAARAYGTGSGQWQITANGTLYGGFAARGADAGVTVSPSWVTNFTLGSAAASGGVRYADKAVRITNDFSLAANSTNVWTIIGTNYGSDTSWAFDGVVHEITGKISGGGAGVVLEVNSPYSVQGRGGNLRLANTNNDFTASVRVSRSGSLSHTYDAVLIVPGDSALGNAANTVLSGSGGEYHGVLLMFEDANPAGPTVFKRNVTVSNCQ
jgi:hypothetical protein